MIIERTYDAEFITQCVIHPQAWGKITDDGCGSPDLYFPQMSDEIYWVRAGDYGVFMGCQTNHVSFDVHTILLPSARGKAVDITIKARDWFFGNSPCKRITTKMPEFNQLALRLALKAGFKVIGVDEKSFQKNGILYSQTILGFSKGD